MADDLVELAERVGSGTLGQASKSELQRYQIALTRSNAYASFAAPQFEQVCDTVRLLLSDAIASEASSTTRRLSIFALVVSVAALIAAFAQVVIAMASRP